MKLPVQNKNKQVQALGKLHKATNKMPIKQSVALKSATPVKAAQVQKVKMALQSKKGAVAVGKTVLSKKMKVKVEEPESEEEDEESEVNDEEEDSDAFDESEEDMDSEMNDEEEDIDASGEEQEEEEDASDEEQEEEDDASDEGLAEELNESAEERKDDSGEENDPHCKNDEADEQANVETVKQSLKLETKNVAEKEAKSKLNSMDMVHGPEYSIFIGNLPKTLKDGQLKTIFGKYGKILTIRRRTITGERILTKKNLDSITTVNAYVRFSTKEEMLKACEMNGQEVGGNHIRVCPHYQKQIGQVNSTVFVGNIKIGTTQNDLYDFFSKVGPIEYIRYMPNKCFAFVCFGKGVSTMKALKLNQEPLNGRPLRIEKIDKERNNVKLNKKGHVVPRKRLPEHNKPHNKGGQRNNANLGKNFHGKVAEKKKSQKPSNSKLQKIMIAKKLKAAMDKKMAERKK
uniref:RRM domain-containing protein n=1 Tax=Anopheles epiroticus TaxID=199890 RepID=A0A182PAH2_9DIPT